MLARTGKIPTGRGWSFEPKLDGFRALVSTCGERVRVRSRRGWDMSRLVPELATLPRDVILDGELIAYGADGRPDFPRLSERMLHGRHGITVRLIVFDVLAVAGVTTLAQPYSERRAILEELELGPHAEAVAAFEDGIALFAAVEAMGLEGIVAKRLSGAYRPGERGWVKAKNRAYWRYPLEVEAVRKSVERRARATASL